MLGTIDRDHVTRLARALATGDAAKLIETARSLEEFSPDYGQVLDDLAALLTRVALQQLVPGYEGDELFDPALLKELAAAIPGRRRAALLPDRDSRPARSAVRAGSAHRLRDDAGAHAGVSPAGRGGRRARARRAGARRGTASARSAVTRASRPIVRPASAGPIDPVQWSRVIGDLDVSGAARQLATNCALIEHRGNTLQARARSEGGAHAAAGRAADAGAGEISRRRT